MNWDAIGAIGEIVGAIAVVCSLAYLAIQIRNSNKIELAASERATIEEWNRIIGSTLGNSESALAFTKGMHNIENLTDAERMMFMGQLSLFLSHYGESLRMFKKGLLSAEQFSGAEGSLVAILKSKGGAEYWEEFGDYYDTEVRDQVIHAISSNPNIRPYSESKWYQVEEGT